MHTNSSKINEAGNCGVYGVCVTITGEMLAGCIAYNVAIGSLGRSFEFPPFPSNGRVYLRYPCEFREWRKRRMPFFLGNWTRRMGKRERERGERSWNEIVGISMVKIVGMTRGREELRIIKRVFKLFPPPPFTFWRFVRKDKQKVLINFVRVY